MTGVTGAWFCVQCGYVDGPCETIPSEFTDGPCDAEWQPDDEERPPDDYDGPTMSDVRSGNATKTGWAK